MPEDKYALTRQYMPSLAHALPPPPNGDDTNTNPSDKYAHDGETPQERSKRMFEQALPFVTNSVIDVAINGKTEATRLKAAQLVLDRAMGRVGEAAPDTEDVFKTLLAEVVTNTNASAPKSGPSSGPNYQPAASTKPETSSTAAPNHGADVSTRVDDDFLKFLDETP